MPRRCVSLPASRTTYRSGSPATSILKLRLVIPPDSGTNESVLPASAGTRDSARVSSAASSPRRTSSGCSASDVTVAVTSTPALRPRRLAWSRDRGLAGRDVRCDDVLTAALGGEVVDGPGDHDDADEELEHGDRRQTAEHVPAELQEAIDERVRPGVAEIGPEAAECVRRPQADVHDHEAAPDEGEHVDDRPPAAEREERLPLRPAPAPRHEDAQVAQEVAQVDGSGRGDGEDRCAPGAGEDERDRGEDTDADGG